MIINAEPCPNEECNGGVFPFNELKIVPHTETEALGVNYTKCKKCGWNDLKEQMDRQAELLGVFD